MAIVCLVLLCGGMVVYFIGHFWEHVVETVHIFSNKELNEHVANRIMLVGGLAFATGLGLIYLLYKK